MGWADQLAARPRVPLGSFPTPLEAWPRLTAVLGGPRLWAKRDDVVGPAGGGNKTRKLEFLFGEALAGNARAVATFGGLQSNFARQMCGAAAALGLEPHCFYFERRPKRLEGNLLLNHLMGARLHFIPLGSGSGSRSVEQTCRLVRWVVRLTPGCAGRRTYFMPVGGHTPAGALGYVLAAQELEAQLDQMGVPQATIVVAAGTGGTLAGLLAGFNLLRSQHRVVGIDVGKLWRAFPASVAALASEVCGLLGAPYTFAAQNVPLIEHVYAGPGYARATPECVAALRRAAAAEGVLLDPVYTAKALAGLVGLVQQGYWAQGADVVFLHTGGLPALWTSNWRAFAG